MNSLLVKYKKQILFFGAFILPYVYFMTIRPKLVEMEKRFENKITNVSERDAKRMKEKLNQTIKDKEYSNKNI
jgi:hypothetical protein